MKQDILEGYKYYDGSIKTTQVDTAKENVITLNVYRYAKDFIELDKEDIVTLANAIGLHVYDKDSRLE